MFSAYVVTPVPPPAPATIVAMPSPRNARPRYASRFRPVIAATALTWPRFSATRTMATGAISSIACASQTGAVNFGRPNHGAARTAPKSIGFAESGAVGQRRVQHVAGEAAQQDRQPAREAPRAHGDHADGDDRREADPRVERAAGHALHRDRQCSYRTVIVSCALLVRMPPYHRRARVAARRRLSLVHGFRATETALAKLRLFGLHGRTFLRSGPGAETDKAESS